jgi:glycosyltransferase involved in cell wall biosynthesis
MLEAMACGTPVVASRASALPEIGGEAALYVAPDDPHAWASALRSVVDDRSLRDRLGIAGIERAKHFDWNESAERHLRLFVDVARSP